MQTNTDTIAIPDREVERTYNVAFTDREIIVRLRYQPGEEPRDRQGDAAVTEAVKRAERIRNRKGFGPADATAVDCLRETLVEARPLDLSKLATPKPQRRPKDPTRSHDSNGWR